MPEPLKPKPKPQTTAQAQAALTDHQVKDAAKEMMQAELGPKWFAGEQGYAHETLLAKYSPTGEKSLHSETLWETLHLGDPAPVLKVLCHRFQGLFVPVPPAEPGRETIERLMLTAAVEFGHVAQRFLEATDPRGEGGSRITGTELGEIDREIEEALTAYHRLRATIRAGHE